MKILIVTGGSSSERKISLISARAAKQALESNGHSVSLFDFKNGYDELKKALAQFDIVFPIMHGKDGEDGTLYKFLRSSKTPFVGCSPRGAKIAFDKILLKQYCKRKSIPTAAWKIVRNANDVSKFGFPCVLKGSYGGSSHEVAILHSNKDLLRPRVKKILNLEKNRFFVEKLLLGTEVTIGILLDNALPVLEIIPQEGAWFDYKS